MEDPMCVMNGRIIVMDDPSSVMGDTRSVRADFIRVLGGRIHGGNDIRSFIC